MFNTKIVQFKFGKTKMNKNKIGNVENQGMWVSWQYPWTPSWIFEYPHDLDGIVYIGSAHDFHSAFPGDRSSLAPETLNDYLHVNLNMPPLAEFNVWPTVQLFLAEKARREIVQVPSKSSKWFKGVFSEATEENVTVPKCRVKF